MKRKTAPIQPKLRLRDRRRRMMWIKVAAGSAVLLVALAAAFYVARLPSLMIADVEVNGAALADASEINALAEEKLEGSYAYVIPRANAFFAPREEIQKEILARFPEIGTVTLSHRELHTLVITIGERVPAALWCKGGGTPCYSMDENGFIYREAAVIDGVFVRYSGGITEDPVGHTFLPDEFRNFHSFVEETARTVNRTAESVTVEGNDDAALTFAEGGTLRFVRTPDTAGTLANIASVFGSQSFQSGRDFEYVDFRYGNKVFVKFRGE